MRSEANECTVGEDGARGNYVQDHHPGADVGRSLWRWPLRCLFVCVCVCVPARARACVRLSVRACRGMECVCAAYGQGYATRGICTRMISRMYARMYARIGKDIWKCVDVAQQQRGPAYVYAHVYAYVHAYVHANVHAYVCSYGYAYDGQGYLEMNTRCMAEMSRRCTTLVGLF
jgi:hypothetical protein